jgi:dTDP-glucose pyrophosphorylase
MTTSRAVVLAGGLGKRMRASDPDAHLTADQKAAADAGLKAMVPVHGRPFLDYILSALADAGIRDVALVVAPDHDLVRRYYVQQAPPVRTRVTFVVQPQPLGTANALLVAEAWTAGDPFLTLNGDNLYPAVALRDLARLNEPGLPAFDRDDLIATSNIPPERIQSFAIIDVDEGGCLTRIIEKPSDPLSRSRTEMQLADPGEVRPAGGDAADGSGRPAAGRSPVLISMNCWRFDSRIFTACRDVPRSARGEFELPEAVGLAVRRGVMFRAIHAVGPVLDLSTRADAEDVATRLAGLVPHP